MVGNRRSQIQHTPYCWAVALIEAESRVGFGSAVVAEAAVQRRVGDGSKLALNPVSQAIQLDPLDRAARGRQDSSHGSTWPNT